MFRQHSLAVLVAFVCVPLVAVAGSVEYATLLDEMVNLERLAEYPKPAFTCKQFSSYDRRSTDPGEPTDENWFANADRGKHLRSEERNGGTEWVMMDAEGPGAIVRIWSANANDAGIIRIYLDGEEEPALEMPMEEMLADGGPFPFVKPITGVRSRGWNCYLPIPYAKHCKMTASKPDFYYQVNYRTYEKGTKLDTWSWDLAAEHEEQLKSVARQLGFPAAPDSALRGERHPISLDVPPGTTELDPIEGEAAIYRLSLRAEAEDMEAALRGCALEIAFDGEQVPSVQAPLGDFFGAAPGVNPYQGLPCGVLTDGTMYSKWVMPFKKRARIRFVNTTDLTISLRGFVLVRGYDWHRRTLRFHAKWRSEYPIRTRPRQDWTYVEVMGRGRFVGDMLHVTNPLEAWWGEGDEKIYVDGEDFPSHFGTGTEDYYGYAWCCNIPFTHAYHNQPRCDGPGNYGQTSVNRFHVIDTIPFEESFRFDMEVWHWAECEIAMAATSYWYAEPGAKDSFDGLAPDELKIIEAPPLPEPERVEGALEGEELEVLEVTGGTVHEQRSQSWGWSYERQVWWQDAEPGDTLTLGFPAEKAGEYEVIAVFTKAPDYGIAQVSIDGQRAGEPMDFYHTEVVAAEPVSLGKFTLEEGENRLKLEITGANPEAEKRHMVGIDYLLLKPVK